MSAPKRSQPPRPPRGPNRSAAANTQRYVAFLRAINVGGHVVKMERLRALFAELGLSNVETFIASGNVLFDAPAADAATLERRVEAHLATALGYEVATFLRTPAELRALAALEPFVDSNGEPAAGHARSIGFLAAAPTAEAREMIHAFADALNEIEVHGREIHWLTRTRISDSKLTGAVFERAAQMRVTFRNVTTVRKLAAR